MGFGFHYSSLPLNDTGRDEASHIAGFPDCQGNSKAIELLAPPEQTLSYSRGAAAPSPKLLLSPLTRTATVRPGYYILLFLLWIYWTSDLTITEHRLSQMWQYSRQNLGYSLGNSLRAATMTWEGPTRHLEFWFGDAAFLMEKSFTHKINSHTPRSSHWNKWKGSQWVSRVLARTQVTSRKACTSTPLSIFNHRDIFWVVTCCYKYTSMGCLHPKPSKFAPLVTMPPAVFGLPKHFKHCTTTTQIEQPLFCP